MLFVIVQFEFKFHFINLPQPPACREASAVRSLGALSRTRALFCALSMMFVCLRLQPWTLLCLCTYSLCLCLRCLIDVRFICLRLQPLTTFGLLGCALSHSLRLSLLCIHSLIEVRFICQRRLVRLTLTQPSACLRLSLCLCIHSLSLSAAACAECANDLGDIVVGVVDIVSRLRTFNANARGICSRSTRLASFAAAASASAEPSVF